MAFDAQGRRAVACPGTAGQRLKDPGTRILRVWDLDSGQAQSLSLAHLTDDSWTGCGSMRFAPDGSLFVEWQGAVGGVFRLLLPSDPRDRVSAETVYAAEFTRLDLSRDGRQLLILAGRTKGTYRFEQLLLFDLATRSSRRITTHGDRLMDAAFDQSGRIIVTGDVDGAVRIGSVAGEEPHLLLGHTEPVGAVAVSPDGRWVASESNDRYLWPMPDLSKPPLHTLPHDALMRKLDALTNLRVVPDGSSSTGWKLEVGPFPGWKDVPEW
jgi:WD40 repeat protein